MFDTLHFAIVILHCLSTVIFTGLHPTTMLLRLHPALYLVAYFIPRRAMKHNSETAKVNDGIAHTEKVRSEAE